MRVRVVCHGLSLESWRSSHGDPYSSSDSLSISTLIVSIRCLVWDMSSDNWRKRGSYLLARSFLCSRCDFRRFQ